MAANDGSVRLSYSHDVVGSSEKILAFCGAEFTEYVQKEALKWWQWESTSRLKHCGWVFWKPRAYEIERSLPLGNHADLIRSALRKLIVNEKFAGCLVQFWAPTKTSEGRTLLTVQNQPFALADYDYASELGSYRMGMCREYNSFHADAECAEEQLGLPGRVFLHQFPEFNPNVKYYTLKEYPQRDLALYCDFDTSWGLPVFERSSHTCVGVLEFVWTWAQSFFFDLDFCRKINHTLQVFGLQCDTGYEHYQMQARDENKACATAVQELKTVLKMVWEVHELPLAMAWVPCSACNDLVRGQLLSGGVEFYDNSKFNLRWFANASKFYHLIKGGFAGILLSPPNMLYCSDITKLSICDYPLMPLARLCNFSSWFTLCLQSSYSGNDIYVLELFLPRYEETNEHHPWTTLSLILETMAENFKTFRLASGKELIGDLFSIEVIDIENGRKFHFVQTFQKIVTKDGVAVLQLGQQDQPPTDVVNSGMNVISEAENFNLPSLELLQSENVTVQLDSSDHGPSISAQNVSDAEQNLIVVTNSEGSTRAMQERQCKNAGVKIDVPLDDILKCKEKNRDDAAKILKVSVSTLKRVCRDYGIKRWPPRVTKKFHSCCSSPIEKQGQTGELNSNVPSNQSLHSVAHIKPALQDADRVKVRAKHENNTVQFLLSLPSGLVALQQEVAKRFSLEAGTYHVKYEDENELILIACDDDLQYCIDTFKSLGKTSIAVLLEPK